MKTKAAVAPIPEESPERERMESLVTTHLCELFNRLPALSGFRLRDDFTLADLSVFTWPGIKPRRGIDGVVMQSLVELAECHPEAVVHMRGRTFVRCLQ
jgi:hypothetical protein